MLAAAPSCQPSSSFQMPETRARKVPSTSPMPASAGLLDSERPLSRRAARLKRKRSVDHRSAPRPRSTWSARRVVKPAPVLRLKRP